MSIKICTTNQWNSQDWASYVKNFNYVFNKDLSIDYFKIKYFGSYIGYCYHSLLINDDTGDIVGSCTAMPYIYMRNKISFKNILVVDVFIHPEYRGSDPLSLRRMYKKLSKVLTEDGFIAVLAVPNATAYPYWKNVVKWKDVGKINYWILPIKAGNIITKYKFINHFSKIYSWLILLISNISYIINTNMKPFKYTLIETKEIIDNRFKYNYTKISDGDIINYYRIVNENNVKTAYLIYSRENGKLTHKSLRKGVFHILTKENVDMILYIGKLSLFQTIFVKVPSRFEPQLLPLTCDLLTKDKQYEDLLDINNIDFSLFNYDVR